MIPKKQDKEIMRKPTENSIFDYLEDSPDDQKYAKWFEKLLWPNGEPISPYDSNAKVYTLNTGYYMCSKTRKKFSIKTVTPVLKNTKLPLRKWYLSICEFLSKKGISAHELARKLRITVKSTYLLLKDLRSLLKQSNFVKKKLKGVVELDETLKYGKEKNKHLNKKIPNSQGRSCKGKTPILGMLERKGCLITVVTSDTKLTTLEPIIFECIEKGSTVYTDDWYRKSRLGKLYNHKMVNHSAKPKQYVKKDANGKITTNSIEGVWSSHFKVPIKGTYHNNISDKYLQNYADEFAFRYNTREWDEMERIEFFLLALLNKPLTYDEFKQSKYG